MYLIWMAVFGVFSYNSIELRSRSDYTVPASIAEARVATGVMAEKPSWNWHQLPFRLLVNKETIYFGCAPNSKSATSCIEPDVYDWLVGKTATVHLMFYERARDRQFYVVQMTVEGKPVVNFEDQRRHLLRVKESDRDNRGWFGLILGIFYGIFFACVLRLVHRRNSPSYPVI